MAENEEVFNFFFQQLAVIADMIGAAPTSPKYGLCLSTSVSVSHKWLFDQLTPRTNRPNPISYCNKHVNPDIYVLPLTDSRNFENNGVPCVLVCNVGGELPDFYHTEDDTVDKIDWDTLSQAIDIMETVVRTAANQQ